MQRQTNILKTLALLSGLSLVLQFVAPIAAPALTGGPAQPEFSSFEPVATTSMVNEFSGSFTYNLPLINIPGPNGAGYPISLSYHSGLTPEQEASWVGYGWTLNPGAISRPIAGFPDDHYAADVRYWTRTHSHQTISVGAHASYEFFSADKPDANNKPAQDAMAGQSDVSSGKVNGLPKNGASSNEYNPNLSASLTLRYNSYKGFGFDVGISAYIKGLASLGTSLSADKGFGFSYRLNPGYYLEGFREVGKKSFVKGLKSLGLYQASNSLLMTTARYGLALASDPVRTVAYKPSYGYSFNVKVGVLNTKGGKSSFLPDGYEGGIFGNYTNQINYEQINRDAYGYMYSGDALDANTLMDYSLEKELPYTRRDHFLAIPHSNADNFIATGEGMIGGFRLHHRQPGQYRPNRVYNGSTIQQLGMTFNAPGKDGEEESGGPAGGSEGTNTGSGVHVGMGYSHSVVEGLQNATASMPHHFRTIDENAAGSDGEPYFFRFIGDRGGSVEFAQDDKAVAVSNNTEVDAIGGLVNNASFSMSTNKVFASLNEGERSGRSSHIAYSTLEEMLVHQQSGGQKIYYRSFNKDQTSRDYFLRYYEDNFDNLSGEEKNFLRSIGEIAVCKPDGARYVYGLPVYSRKESTLQFGLNMAGSEDDTDSDNLFSVKDLPNDQGDVTQEANAPVLSGEERPTPYANSYLLTEITTPDYLDRTNDGPTPDDFGGYVKFNYRYAMLPYVQNDYSADALNHLSNKSGADDKYWYQWRVPYSGMLYERGTLSDGRDDVGQVSRGQKEVYFLESIETRSHIAYFVTNHSDLTVGAANEIVLQGSGLERGDAFEALQNERSALSSLNATAAKNKFDTSNDGPDATIRNAQGEALNKSEVLERVELFAKDADGNAESLVKTVHFEYVNRMDNGYHLDPEEPEPFHELVPDDLPNASTVTEVVGGDIAFVRRRGKLTLRKVWFEHAGIVNARIAPYTFGYHYRNVLDLELPPESSSKYADLFDCVDEYKKNDFYDINEFDPQNPQYHAANTDPWGYYRMDGAIRHREMRNWLDQTPNADFDPAAWHLKWIGLPSGGEIHVHYEQNDYSYVQDRRATAMVGMVNSPNDSDTRMYVDVAGDLGIPMSAPFTNQANNRELHLYREFLRDYFSISPGYNQARERVYFKLLYALNNGAAANLDRNNGEAEYISGYAYVDNVDIDNDGLFLELGTPNEDFTIPRTICDEFLKTHMRGVFTESGGHFAALFNNKINGLLTSAQDDIPGLVEDLLSIGANVFADPECGEMSNAFSYLRLPLLRRKLGGGVRVKHLLLYDRGMTDEQGMLSEESALYGREYHYETIENGLRISSGVAANEPRSIREENALLRPMQKQRALTGFWRNVLSGNSKWQIEGPLGEYLLPAPSVGYSRVIVTDIHNPERAQTGSARPGQTTSGFTVMDFHTSRDWPLARHTSYTQPNRKQWQPLPVFTHFGGAIVDHESVTQGYSFVLFDISGQPAQVSTYAGSWADFLDENPPETADWSPSTQINYSYFQPGDKIQLFDGVHRALRESYPGKEMEVVMAGKSITDITVDGRLEMDIGVSQKGNPPTATPTFSLFPEANYNEAELRTHVTSKVVRYPAIVKSIETKTNEIHKITENLAFDPRSGAPVISRTRDGYDGLTPLVTNNLPDHDGSYYTASLPAAQQYDAMSQKADNERLILRSNTLCNLSTTYGKDGNGVYIGVYAASDQCRCLFLDKVGPGDLLEVVHVGSGDILGVFHVEKLSGQRIDLLPTYYSAAHDPAMLGEVVTFSIVRSGRTNQLGLSAGSLTSYGGNPGFVLPEELRRRQQFVDQLNKLLRAGGGSILGSELPAGLQFILDPDIMPPPQCMALPPDEAIDITVNENEVLIEIGRGRTVNTQVQGSHPLVSTLNGLLNQFWGHVVDGNIVSSADQTIVQSCPVVSFDDKQYRRAALRAIQEAINNAIDLLPASNFAKIMNGEGEPVEGLILAMSLVPTDDDNYDREGPTALRHDGVGTPYLSSLRLLLGEDTILESWAQGNSLSNLMLANFPWSSNVPAPLKCVEAVVAPGFFTSAMGAFSQDIDGYLLFNDYAPTPPPGQPYRYDDIRFAFLEVVETQTPYFSSTIGNPCPADNILQSSRYDRWTKNFVSATIPPDAMRFLLDEDGNLKLYRGAEECCPVDVADDGSALVWNFCPDTDAILGGAFVRSVLSASATSYSDDWNYSGQTISGITPAGANIYETGERGKWRLKAAYTYDTQVVGGALVNNYDPTWTPLAQPQDRKVHNDAGVFHNFEFFDWRAASPAAANDWLEVSAVTRYSPDGAALEEVDALGIYSAAKFGYRNMMPYLTGRNAPYDALKFESFENVYPGNFAEDGLAVDPQLIVDDYVHTGRHSLKIMHNTAGPKYEDIPVLRDADGDSRGWTVDVWMRVGEPRYDESALTPPLRCVVTGGATNYNFVQIARSGEWALLQAHIAGGEFGVGGAGPTSFDLTIENTAAYNLRIDDLRVQPEDASMTCYVYDKDRLLLLASLDDQHFSTLYRYNAEGRLVRRMRETERGIKTLTEKHYHVPLSDRHKAYTWDPIESPFDPFNDEDDDPNIGTSLVQPGTGATNAGQLLPGVKSGAAPNRFDLLNIQLSPDKQSVQLPDSVELELPNFRKPGLADSNLLRGPDSAGSGLKGAVKNRLKQEINTSVQKARGKQ